MREREGERGAKGRESVEKKRGGSGGNRRGWREGEECGWGLGLGLGEKVGL